MLLSGHLEEEMDSKQQQQQQQEKAGQSNYSRQGAGLS